MAVKYICPKCGRRFVDWGAEKLDFKCPTEECEGETLVLPGSGDDEHDERPVLKRSKKRKAIVPPVVSDMDIAEMDGTFIESDDVDVDDEEEEEADVEEEEEVVVAPTNDEVDDDVLIDDDDAVDDEDDDTFTEALDIGGEEIALEED
ncbi:MAG TPA: hypothetical protein ENN29_14180 [Candidatus Hydrogenedentes bacterium]|nr:hypothetical protein [Candidatus Hydrogenedentota bacterium]